MTAALEARELGKRYRRRWALADCTLTVPAGRVTGLVGPNGAGKTTLLQLAAGLLDPTSGEITVLGGRPGAARPGRLRRPGRAGLQRAFRRRAPAHGRLAQPWLGQRARRAPYQPARPSAPAAGRVAVRRPAGPARPHPRGRQAARAAAARRAGRQPGPPRAAGVPAEPHGDRGRARDQRRAVLAPDHRHRAGLRLPHRPHRLPGPASRGDRGTAGVAPPPVRTPPRSPHPAGELGGHRGKPRRQAEHAAGPHLRPDPRPGLDRPAGHPGGHGPRLHEPARRGRAGRTARIGDRIMIRFAWTRFRTQAAVGAGLLAVVAVVLAVTGIQLAHSYDAAVAVCRPQGDCAGLFNIWPSNGYLTADNILGAIGLAAPGLIGMFWGTPLVAREFETGTFRLAWTQGVTRTRWLAAKLGIAGVSPIAAAELFSLMVNWWASPIHQANPGYTAFTSGSFHAGIAPAGYAAFAFALGVTAGLLIRRTLPAMAVTLAVYTAVIIAFPGWVRPPLIPPVQATSTLSPSAIANLLAVGASDGHLSLVPG